MKSCHFNSTVLILLMGFQTLDCSTVGRLKRLPNVVEKGKAIMERLVTTCETVHVNQNRCRSFIILVVKENKGILSSNDPVCGSREELAFLFNYGRLIGKLKNAFSKNSTLDDEQLLLMRNGSEVLLCKDRVIQTEYILFEVKSRNLDSSRLVAQPIGRDEMVPISGCTKYLSQTVYTCSNATPSTTVDSGKERNTVHPVFVLIFMVVMSCIFAAFFKPISNRVGRIFVALRRQFEIRPTMEEALEVSPLIDLPQNIASKGVTRREQELTLDVPSIRDRFPYSDDESETRSAVLPSSQEEQLRNQQTGSFTVERRFSRESGTPKHYIDSMDENKYGYSMVNLDDCGGQEEFWNAQKELISRRVGYQVYKSLETRFCQQRTRMCQLIPRSTEEIPVKYLLSYFELCIPLEISDRPNLKESYIDVKNWRTWRREEIYLLKLYILLTKTVFKGLRSVKEGDMGTKHLPSLMEESQRKKRDLMQVKLIASLASLNQPFQHKLLKQVHYCVLMFGLVEKEANDVRRPVPLKAHSRNVQRCPIPHNQKGTRGSFLLGHQKSEGDSYSTKLHCLEEQPIGRVTTVALRREQEISSTYRRHLRELIDAIVKESVERLREKITSLRSLHFVERTRDWMEDFLLQKKHLIIKNSLQRALIIFQ